MNELLLRRAQQGDPAAFEALVTPAETMLWRLCWSYVRQTQDAEDCLQETMLRAWKRIGSFRGECAVESWLYRICVTVCLDFLRSRTRRERGRTELPEGAEPADAGSDPALLAEERARNEAVQEALTALPDEMREALVLTQVAGIGYAEAAETLGVSEGTVKSRVNRARQKLRKKFDALWEPSRVPGVLTCERRERT